MRSHWRVSHHSETRNLFGSSRFLAERSVHLFRDMSKPKCCVYVLRNLGDRTRYYTGLTSDWRGRLDAHNAGKCPHTAEGRPWEIDVFVQFGDEPRAVGFER
jgi:putative endonuclease